MGRTMAPSPARGSRHGPDQFFARLGRICVRRRWWIVGVWLVVLAVAAPLAPSVVGELRAGGVLPARPRTAGGEGPPPHQPQPPPAGPRGVPPRPTAAPRGPPP